ncbi:MAG: NAD(P)H-dependent oxidoreductase subunit E [Acidimicrobiia bacterium]|nr:NAD(P)H-dependent oxidoreductase subunit E [Acidimicrobiia bacterium]
MTDIHLGPERATEAEAAAIDAVIDAELGPAVLAPSERLVVGGTARRNERRHLLLPALHALQHISGWISPGGLNHICDALQVPPAEAYGVATFYDLFRVDDPGHDRDVLHVCVDPACRIERAGEVIAAARAEGRPVQESPCLGQCERPVACFVQGRGRPDHTPADADPPLVPQAGNPTLRLLRRVGVVDPTRLEAYVGSGGYRALTKAFTLSADGVIAELEASKLMGRGGAAFPTGTKWRAVADAPGQPKHIVVNADESEPGTFKDRILLENDPFAVIEAVTIAGFATGAAKGWIYLRGEYPLAAERLTNAVAQAREAGFLGERTAGSSFSFDIELRRGAGAYICGEETALFNSLEGFRGEPRQKPPFPVTHGLFNRPTVINNPETLANVPGILLDGGAAYAAIGTEGSTGTKLFCLSGRVARPGLYEVPFGATLGDLVDLAGGVAGSGRLRAVLVGGAAGSFVGPDQLSVPLTFEGARAAGVSLGSGVVVVFDDSVDITDVVRRIAHFFRHESCGQCVPCRVGTTRQHELLEAAGGPSAGLLEEIDRAMKDASICGLGHTAATAVRSALALGLIRGQP